MRNRVAAREALTNLAALLALTILSCGALHCGDGSDESAPGGTGAAAGTGGSGGAAGAAGEGGSAETALDGRFIDDQRFVIHENASAGDRLGHAKPYPTVTLHGATFQLVAGNENGVFTMDSSSGSLSVADASGLSASTTPSYELTVEVEDPIAGTDRAKLHVQVLAAANVVFIDPENTADPSQDGSLAHPYDSFDDVGFTEGFAYLFRRGTTIVHDDSVELAAHDVLLGAYGSGPRPIYHCTAVASGSNRHALYFWNSRRNITIRDLEIYAPDATSCIRFGGEDGANATVDNCVVHGAGWGIRSFQFSGLRVVYTEVYEIADDGMFIQNMTDVELAYNDVHDVNTNWVPPYTPETVASGDAIQLSDCNDWHVHHNLLDRTNSGNKFCFISNNPTQDTGVLEYNRMLGPLTDGDGGASIYFADGDGLIVRYNTIEGPSPGALYHHSDNLLFHGNVVAGTSGGVTCLSATPCTLYNNVFHQVPRHIYASGDVVAKNNIFSLVDAADVAIVCDGALDESHNLYSRGPVGAGSIQGDPLFVDAAQGDFHLQEGSPAIDAGTDVGLTEDMDGNPIPTAGTPDIGAYEFQPP